MEAVGSVDALNATIHELNAATIAQEEEHSASLADTQARFEELLTAAKADGRESLRASEITEPLARLRFPCSLDHGAYSRSRAVVKHD